MPRQARVSVANVVYHVINRANGRVSNVEQNPLRAKLVERAEDWQWSSLWRREKGSEKEKRILAPLPKDLPANYLQSVNDVLKEDNLNNLRNSVNKGTPFEKDSWVEMMIEDHNLGYTVRGRGRPKSN